MQDSPLSFLKYQDIDGMTPLMAAVDKDHVQTAKLLLDEVSSAKKKKFQFYGLAREYDVSELILHTPNMALFL